MNVGDRVKVKDDHNYRGGQYGNIAKVYARDAVNGYDIAFADGVDGVFYEDELLPVDVLTMEGKPDICWGGPGGLYVTEINIDGWGLLKRIVNAVKGNPDEVVRITIERIKKEA